VSPLLRRSWTIGWVLQKLEPTRPIEWLRQRALSDKTSLRRARRLYIRAVGQNTLHSGTLKRALRSSAWLWCFMFVFRSHSVTWKNLCTNEALRSATKRCGFGGTDLVRYLDKFAAVHSSFHNHLNQERHLYSRQNFKTNRATALAE